MSLQRKAVHRFTAYIVLLAMIFNIAYIQDLSGFSVHADVVGTHEDGTYTYILYDDSTAKITAYSGSGGDITLPDKVTVSEAVYYDVSAIGSQLFTGNTSIESVVIPEGIETIEGDGIYSSSGAFTGCTSLESVTLPGTLKEIGDLVFSGCSALETIELPDSLETLGMGAFAACEALSSVELPDSLETLNGTFDGCIALSSVKFPGSLEEIGSRTFYN